jgi:hypothetical protein
MPQVFAEEDAGGICMKMTTLLSFLGTPERASIHLEGRALGKYVIFGKCRESHFKLLNCPGGPYNGSFRMILGSFSYWNAPRGCSTKPFTKRLSSYRGM